MIWLLQGSEVTPEHQERMFLGGLTEATLWTDHGHVFLEMDENSSEVQKRVVAAFPEAERVEGATAVYFETAGMRRRAVEAVLGVEAEFLRLKKQWREQTKYQSSLRVDHPIYQAIVALGPDVVPFLLREMRDDPDHWSTALIALTGENPVPETYWGNLKAVARVWVEWGKSKGLLV